MKRINYKGFNLDIGSKAELYSVLSKCLDTAGCKQAITINPEFIVLAGNNPELKSISNSADIIMIDGFGLAWAVKKYAKGILRYPGADAVSDLLKFAAEKNFTVGIIARPKGLSSPERIERAIRKLFPALQEKIWNEDNVDIEKINQENIQLLILTLGQPKQEIWISENKSSLRTCKLVIGAGGAIDFLTGAKKRAPGFFRKIGLEWLWRLIIQPSRIKRIWRATFGFWYTILFKL